MKLSVSSAGARLSSSDPVLLDPNVLVEPGKILFVAHLALGDFAYLQNCFLAFAKRFPLRRIDLWVDEVRRTGDASRWEQLRKYSLYDWVRGCGLFGKVYDQTYSPQLLAESLAEARAENYPIVVSLANLRPQKYARMARSIAPDGQVIGLRRDPSLFRFHHELSYRLLDSAIALGRRGDSNSKHISDIYAERFERLCGLIVPPTERFPFVKIPERWIRQAREQWVKWEDGSVGRRVFVNPFAKTRKRSWPLERVVELILAMRERSEWSNATFVVNATPEERDRMEEVLRCHVLFDAHCFSAIESFFQLPATLAECDLVISVETAVMHLASAVRVPVIALMRKKNPEWVPFDRERSIVLTAPRRRDWVDAILVSDVLDALRQIDTGGCADFARDCTVERHYGDRSDGTRSVG